MKPEFRREDVEDAVRDAIKAATGVDVAMAPPTRHVGVVAFARLPRDVAGKMDWPALAAAVEARTGLVPLCVEDDEWTDCPIGHGLVTLVAFDVVGVHADWPYDWGNKLPSRTRRAA